jgi:acyl-CoA synthetase (AMP-forming)/AMP-acid ligase II
VLSLADVTAPPSLGLIAERNAELVPAAEAVVDGERRLSWAQVFDRTARLAGALRDRIGCVPGDRVAFIGDNCIEGFELFHASARAGVLIVPINDRLAPAELAAILDSVEPRALLYTPSHADLAHGLSAGTSIQLVAIDAAGSSAYDALIAGSDPASAYLPEEIPPNWVSSICFTSGTTGRPKGVLMTHTAQLAFAQAQAVFEPIEPGARHLFVRPMAVAPGHRMIAWHGLLAGTTVIAPRFNQAEFFRLVEQERITNVLLAPTMLRLLLDHGNPDGHSLSSLQSIIYGGAPMSSQLLREVLDFFPCSLVQGYGGSEAGQVLFLSAEDHRAGRIDTNGRPVAGVEIEIRGADSAPVSDGEVGQLHVRSRQLMAGYWRDPVNTAKALVDGWYATGDLAERELDGYVRVVGRVSDMIISGGFNVMPAEVEEVIAAHPGVLEVAVFGAPDPLWGEAVHAVVVCRSGTEVSVEELIALCRDRLASFKKPRSIAFVDALPRTGVGKVNKAALREGIASRP